MEVLEIIHTVNRLPQSQQMLIVERIVHSMRQKKPSMEIAAERLYEDYMTDKNLIAFTQLDYEDFYEAR